MILMTEKLINKKAAYEIKDMYIFQYHHLKIMENSQIKILMILKQELEWKFQN